MVHTTIPTARYAILQCNCEIQAKELLQKCPVYDGNRVEEEKVGGCNENYIGQAQGRCI